MYYVKLSEPGLWTVGCDLPGGKWEPESDHDLERDAKRRAHRLNGVEVRFVYWRSEPGLWTVGEVAGEVRYPFSDHGSADEAADEVIRLNS